MKRHTQLRVAALLVTAGTGLLGAQRVFAEGDDTEIPFSTVKIFIEFNDTDQDVGIQVLLDGEPWKKVSAFNPNGKKILNITTRRSLQQQGLSELFFESSEPSLDEVSLEEFLKRFPEGEYEFEGRTIEGAEIEGESTLTHVIPAGPVIVSPPQGDEPPVMDPDNAVIAWAAVTATIDGSSDIEISGYQVIVVHEDSLREYLIDLPASTTSVSVPPEFFADLEAEYGFEVLAIEVSGNQTISSGEFVVAP